MTHPLTAIPYDPILDLDPWIGQRSASYRFALTNGVTNQVLGEITPLRDATLSHSTTSTIKRTLSFGLGVADTAQINTITDRVDVFMVFPGGVEYPLGRYMFTNVTRKLFTSGSLAAVSMSDEMFLVDQPITAGISGVLATVGGPGIETGTIVDKLVQEVVAGLPIALDIESTTLTSLESWGSGTFRGQILESLSVSGDYFSPWFGNDKKFHFIRTFDPFTRVPDFDFDRGNKVLRDPIVEDDDLITAPNRIIVISNDASDASKIAVGIADIPETAPHSIPNRGFVIADVRNLQIPTAAEAFAVAQGLAQRQTVFERVVLDTAPDPRHDSYNVILWQGEKWLEIGWSMALKEGGEMRHTLRKAYS